MIFRKIGCLVVTSNLVKLKSISSWPKIIAKTMENDFRFHFHFKWFPALENRRERERERERKSKKITDIGARRSHRSNHSNPPSSNPVTDHRDRLAISGPHAKRETERVERSSHHRRDRLAIVLEPARTRLPTNPLALRRSHRRVAPRTREPVTNSFSFLFEIFVIKFVCDFDFLLSLFDLWFFCCCCGGVGGGVLVVFLLCGGGFCGGGGGK